jgi:hypothetical protein
MGITVLDKNQNFIMTNSTFQAMVGTGIEPQHVDKIFGSFFTTKVDGIMQRRDLGGEAWSGGNSPQNKINCGAPPGWTEPVPRRKGEPEGTRMTKEDVAEWACRSADR